MSKTIIIIYLFIYLFTYLFIYLFIYSFIYLFIYLFVYLFIYLFICLFIYLFIYLFVSLFIYLFIYLKLINLQKHSIHIYIQIARQITKYQIRNITKKPNTIKQKKKKKIKGKNVCDV